MPGICVLAATSDCVSFLQHRCARQFSTDGMYVPFPVAADGRVFLGVIGGRFRVLDIAEGNLHWTIDDTEPSCARQVVGDDVVFVGGPEGWLYVVLKG